MRKIDINKKRSYTKSLGRSRKWCILRDSSELKFVIKYRMERLGWNVKKLAMETNIDRPILSSYLNHDYSTSKYRMPDQRELLIIADKLDIDVSLNVEFRAVQEDNRRTPAPESSLRRAKWRISD